MTLRQVVLDTETTGLEVEQGHRVIEIGCVELVDRRRGGEFHRFLNPGREIDAGAQNVHGISNEALADKPRFAEIVDDLLRFIEGAELIIHNASFDVGFLNAELKQCGRSERLEPPLCTVTDSLALARRLHPGQRASLDALCRRYEVNNARRELHGALLDAELLAEVWLAMTGGQAALGLEAAQGATSGLNLARLTALFGEKARAPLVSAAVTAEENQTHQARLQAIRKRAGRLRWDGELPAEAGPDA